MTENVADTSDFRSRDLWMARFQLVGEVAACLGDDLDAALNEPLSLPVGLELVIAHPGWVMAPRCDVRPNTWRRSSKTERRLTLAVLTTERKAA